MARFAATTTIDERVSTAGPPASAVAGSGQNSSGTAEANASANHQTGDS